MTCPPLNIDGYRMAKCPRSPYPTGPWRWCLHCRLTDYVLCEYDNVLPASTVRTYTKDKSGERIVYLFSFN